MTKRRSRGDGGLHWDDKRQRWIATASLGYDGRGKRVVKRGSGRTKTEAKIKLTEVLRGYEDGLAIGPATTPLSGPSATGSSCVICVPRTSRSGSVASRTT
jgi:hypothetical protein